MVYSGDGQTTQTGQESGIVRSRRVDATSVQPLLRAGDQPRLVWAEGETTIAATGAARTLLADGPNRFETITEDADALFDRLEGDVPDPARPRLFGGFSFTDDHTDPGEGGRWEGYPGALFLLPAVQLVVTPDAGWLTAVEMGPGASERAAQRLENGAGTVEVGRELDDSYHNGDHGTESPGVCSREYAPPRADWQREIEQVTDRIERDQLQKVVLAQALSVQTGGEIDPCDVLDRLSGSYPDCFRFLFEPANGGTFLGATPERLVSLAGRGVETEALAGSIGRGETVAEDEWLASQLRDSEKNNHEHDLVVDAVLDQLGQLTSEIRTGARVVRKLATVQHLQTPIRATLSTDRHVLELVEALHPTPAVGGLPPDSARQTIRETEVFDRGWYAAPVGWFDERGDGDFAVAIRSALTCDHTATLFAGAGIVNDSDPDEEWDELQLKYRPILDELA